MRQSLLARTALTALFLLPATLPAGAAAGTIVGVPAATQSVVFIVHLSLRKESDLEALVAAQSDPKSPIYRHFLTPAQFRASFAPSARALRSIQAALVSQQFAVARASTQTLAVRGRVADVERAFGIHLRIFRGIRGLRIATNEQVRQMPALAQMGAEVTGLESRQRLHVHSYVFRAPLNRYSRAGPYWWSDLKQAYTAPTYTALDGTGANIAIVISNDFLDSDLAAAFDHEKFTSITGKPVPVVHRVPIFGGAPFDPSGASLEVSLDTQMSLGTAPGATEWLYDMPDLSDESVMAAYTKVVDDNKADIVSSSFGGCELFYKPAYNNGTDYTYLLKDLHQIFLQGNAQGITFVASTGDSSGLGCTTPDYLDGNPSTTAKFIPGVQTPANDPAVTAVGGTNLTTTTPPNPQPAKEIFTSKYVSESEYPDTEIPYDPYGLGKNVTGGLWGSGSGTSVIFKKPLYQYFVNTHANRRTVPDVSMQMGGCPTGISLVCQPNDSGAVIAFDTVASGFFDEVIGTSASAPEFAGTLALAVQRAHSRLGNVNYVLYAESALNTAFGYPFFHQGIPGSNGVVQEGSSWHGYSRILGVGTPHTRNMIGAHDINEAGDPQRLSNP